jgi:hypothetical protein
LKEFNNVHPLKYGVNAKKKEKKRKKLGGGGVVVRNRKTTFYGREVS